MSKTCFGYVNFILFDCTQSKGVHRVFAYANKFLATRNTMFLCGLIFRFKNSNTSKLFFVLRFRWLSISVLCSFVLVPKNFPVPCE